MPDKNKRKRSYHLVSDGELNDDFVPDEDAQRPGRKRKPHDQRRRARFWAVLLLMIGLAGGILLSAVFLRISTERSAEGQATLDNAASRTASALISTGWAMAVTDPPPTSPPISGALTCRWVLNATGDKIAFVAIGSQPGIYLTDVDGDGQFCLPVSNRLVADPAWSPDGSKIAFRGLDTRNFEHIFIMNPDGSDIRQLVTNGKSSRYPIWSPDGSLISYVWLDDSTVYHLCVMNADGSNQRCLASPIDRQPTAAGYWSPDGTRLVFSGIYDNVLWREDVTDSQWEIYTIRVDGTGFTRLTDNEASDSWPHWSPDGQKILFHSNRDNVRAVYTMNPDGTNVTTLTPLDSNSMFPAWSPDGNRIAFLSRRTGVSNVWVMEADGSHARNLTNSLVDDYAPVWSPDGTRIIFYREIDRVRQLFMVNVDGGGEKQLTHGEWLGSTDQVSWNPVP